jgi:putative transposase
MFRLLRLLCGLCHHGFCSRRDLLLENLVLRQQLAVLKQRKRRPKLDRVDKLFWVVVQKVWSEWGKSLLIVTPETVVRWHRAGFRRYWHWRSRREISCGRRRISREVRELIFQMVAQNPTWGAPRVHGELLKLGFSVSERTVSRWTRRAPTRPDANMQWRAFLSNHREVIAAMDFSPFRS